MNTFPASSDCSCLPCADQSGNGSAGPPGPPGATGATGAAGTNGTDSFTTTSSSFTMPAVSASVSVAVLVSAWAAIGQVVYVQGVGYFSVNSKPDSTHVSLTNLGYTGNVVAGTVTANGLQISPGGLVGPAGAAGSSTLNQLSPTTTKGDIIVDNGANNPNASDVRFAVGGDGKAIVADSSQATGLNYATITPNTVTNANDIPRFSGTSGTPMAVKDSKLLITDDGAIQSTPSGGNARGSKAVDLQVDRAANTQVASGADSVISGGKNNTAAGSNSVVSGGNGNSSSNINSSVCGGSSNLAQGDNAFIGGGSANQATNTNASVCGGATNVATAANTHVGGGSQNTASAGSSTVVAGTVNTASGTKSFVGGGTSNTASGASSSIVGGEQALVDKYGQSGHASGFFAGQGDAQVSELIARNNTTDATPTNLFLDGSALKLVIPLNTSWCFEILLVGRSSAGVTACWVARGGLQNVANTVSMTAACTASVLADGTGATWGVAGGLLVTADNTNKALNLVATGAAATLIRWVAKISLVEVVY